MTLTLTEIILTVIVQALFCLGFRTIISEGMILHFLRRPFEYEEGSKTMNFLRTRVQRRALKGEEGLQQVRRDYTKLSRTIGWFLKPVLLCVVCFSSFWGALVFLLLNGLLLPELILCCICTSFLIKFVNDKVDW